MSKMKKFIAIYISFWVVLWTVGFAAKAQDAKNAKKDPAPAAATKPAPDNSEEAPKISIEKREAVENLQKQQLMLYIQGQQIQKKYQDEMNQDPAFIEWSRQNDQVNRELAKASADAASGIDQNKWEIDWRTLTVHRKVEPATPPKK